MSEYYTRWPDFHCWFPNQAYRGEQHNKQQMIQDLDRLLEEIVFPLDRFYKLMNGWKTCSNGIRNIYVNARRMERETTPEEEQETDRLEARSIEIKKELDELIDPVYQCMLDMGYSKEELQYLSTPKIHNKP